MANKFTRVSNFGVESHFSQAVTGELVYSRMLSSPKHITTFNAGDIIPIGCFEVLPHDTFEMSMDFVIRQTTTLFPTMGSMTVDFYAFEVPNRVVNSSWKTVMGENPNGSWTAPNITLAPLLQRRAGEDTEIQIPVHSVADYYGFPTQQLMPVSILEQCHDLKFRGYVDIYNEYFRDQNYQPPIPMSKLNVYQGFFDDRNLFLTPVGSQSNGQTPLYYAGTVTSGGDGSFGNGAVLESVYGGVGKEPSGSGTSLGLVSVRGYPLSDHFYALGKPLKSNKLHDYFTSVEPSPLKGEEVLLPIAGNAPVRTMAQNVSGSFGTPMRWRFLDGYNTSTPVSIITGATGDGVSAGTSTGDPVTPSDTHEIVPANLYADLSSAPAATLSDLRMAAAIQQVYEALAYGGSRYREVVRVLFGLDVDNPYEDIPTLLGHFRRELDLYQTAQTSSSETSGSPQGNLAAFGYTSNGGYLFKKTFLEHGYVHILAVVRQKNVYSSYMARDNFRMSMLDWYQPPLANISQQPVFTKQVNPFTSAPDDQVFGYQEAWAEYRYDPDMVSGLMRPNAGGQTADLSAWNYADPFAPDLDIATGEWLKSNAEEVLNRTLAIPSINEENPQNVQPQLKGEFLFKIDKERPMPTYSVPGLDIF